MPATDNPLMTLLEEMSHSDENTSALAKLGKLLYSIPTMNPREVAVLWHLLEVCRANATSAQSKEIVRVVRISLFARMRQILHGELSSESWGQSDVSQIMAIMEVNSVPKESKKKGFLQRILSAA